MDDFHDDERDRPGDDITDDGMGTASGKSTGCPFCDGGGWTTIYHINYTGEPVVSVFDGYRSFKRKVMRTVAYCTCAAGRKMMFAHKDKARDEYVKIADLNDVAAGRYREWQTDDPSIEPLTATELATLPHRLRDTLRRMSGGNHER